MDARRNDGLDVTDAIELYACLLRDRFRLHLKLDPEQNTIQFVVCDAEFSLVRLSGPKARGRGLVHDFVREAEVRGHLADLGLVEISDGEEVRPRVAEFGIVSNEDLTLVAGPHHDAVLRVRAVV